MLLVSDYDDKQSAVVFRREGKHLSARSSASIHPLRLFSALVTHFSLSDARRARPWCNVANRTVQADVIVMLDVTLHQMPWIVLSR